MNSSLKKLCSIISILLFFGMPAHAAFESGKEQSAATLLSKIKTFVDKGNLRDYNTFGIIFDSSLRFSGVHLLVNARNPDYISPPVIITVEKTGKILRPMKINYNITPDGNVNNDLKPHYLTSHHSEIASIKFSTIDPNKIGCITRKQAISFFGANDIHQPSYDYDHKLSMGKASDIYVHIIYNTMLSPPDEDQCATDIELSQYTLDK